MPTSAYQATTVFVWLGTLIIMVAITGYGWAEALIDGPKRSGEGEQRPLLQPGAEGGRDAGGLLGPGP
jgi:hypothetical protein